MRERGLSSCEMSCSSREASSVLVPASSLMPAALETWTWELPSWVLSRRRAVFAALEEYQFSEVAGLILQVCLRLFLESDCRTLRAVLGFGGRSDREGCDLSAIGYQHVLSLCDIEFV